MPTTIIAQDWASHETLRTFIDTLPQQFDQGGELLYDERNIIKCFDIDGQAFVVKRFKRPNLPQRIAYTFFRRSKAERAFYNGQELIKRGIDTPQPVAFMLRKSCGLLCDSYYICGRDDNPPVADLFNRVEVFDRPLAQAFALFAASLHEKGILHHDLNSTNTLYHQQSDGTYTFSVIDINRMAFYDQCPPLPDCLENLTRFTGNMQLFAYVAYFYADRMATHFGLPAPDLVQQAVAQKEKHDARWRRRKSLLKKLKKLLLFK